MKELINKILEDTKQLFIYIINKLFKKVEDKIPEDLGANFYGPMEADPRDFKVENVLGKPSEEELNQIPLSYNLLSKTEPEHYVYQGSIPCCTCASLSNYMIVTEVLERNNKDINVDCCYLRQKLGHKCIANERGDYLEKALKTLKANGVKAKIDGYDTKLTIDGYAYMNYDKNAFKYWISKGFPIYYAFRGNRQTWIEISRGEITTVNFTPTGGHAVIAIGYDNDYLYFMNSWRANDGSQYEGDYSVFKIKWINLDTMVKNGLANWRGWVVYNHKDKDTTKQPFEDYKIDETTETGKAVKEMYELGIVKGENGKLYPDRPLTRLEGIVMLDRLYKRLSSK